MCVEGISNSLPERYPSWLNSLMSLEGVKSCKCSLFYSRNLWGSWRVRPLSVFLVGTRQTFRCLRYLCRKPEPCNDDLIHRFNVKIIIQIRPHVTSHGYLLYKFLFPNQAPQAILSLTLTCFTVFFFFPFLLVFLFLFPVANEFISF